MKEAARVYSKIHQQGLPVDFLDIGGGLGVDYDGSKTRFESSMNYTVQEFANDVVYTVKTVCDEENVPHPNLVTESGRMMTAYHTVLVVSIREEIETFADDQPVVLIDGIMAVVCAVLNPFFFQSHTLPLWLNGTVLFLPTIVWVVDLVLGRLYGDWMRVFFAGSVFSLTLGAIFYITKPWE